MNGAQSLIRTLVDSGVEVCFANPGTSEMHFVAALDSVPEMRGVLGLFEGVVTGAADGYARIAGKPAATLLHLGPGLGNGLANLHNARRGYTPIVNIVGDHATYHKKYDAPLESDIPAIASSLQGWVRESDSTKDVGADAAAAVAASMDPPGRVATLVLPADISWGDGGTAVAPIPPRKPQAVAASKVSAVADALRSGEQVALLVGGPACREAGLRAVSRIAAATGAKPLIETFPARLERGAGLPAIERLGYLAEQASYQLSGVKHLVVAGAKSPVSFFAYPGKPSDLVPDGAQVHTLAELDQDVVGALEALADEVAAGVEPVLQEPQRPALPSGPLSAQNWVEVIGALLPERAIISDEANTSGLLLPAATAGAPRHDVLTLTGGAIGQGLPVATGAAVAAPDRPVIALQSDGSALYTISALWTQARENLDVTTVILNNSAYAILRMELQRVGAESGGPKANALLDLSRPDLDFAKIAEGMGVPATRATTAEELADQFKAAIAEPGPHLIDAVVPSMI
ncbi:acetolactate synthase-1/2/3 large subunit [Amycolatopsis bartoniae]|uniref:Acetolactate synthase I/II/III large subunit n=1 Tax=Amycolatopsis bartoniae TaxID=941986 RepID=A0A8H9MCU8_9PSEU|nr:acetolactate synthase large subunit [Amycolatopsis bartoniae]MBB2934491.1 acetolactate synthase-1/2/3 large subunit [Amycolatopsis bartoniae]TVT01870.1 acetolactate synthase large subunit [Amycolatopsis bartoniae]GHF47016.1 acetolactate synthase I/II/III large subunit [Amycolatopsis bartoniae]